MFHWRFRYRSQLTTVLVWKHMVGVEIFNPTWIWRQEGKNYNVRSHHVLHFLIITRPSIQTKYLAVASLGFWGVNRCTHINTHFCDHVVHRQNDKIYCDRFELKGSRSIMSTWQYICLHLATWQTFCSCRQLSLTSVAVVVITQWCHWSALSRVSFLQLFSLTVKFPFRHLSTGADLWQKF